MAPSISSLSPAAPAYIPKRVGAPWIPPPPPPAPVLTTYVCMAAPPPEFLPWPALVPPPLQPCWSITHAPCVPAGLHHGPPFHGVAVEPVPHGAMAMTPPSGPAPGTCWPRRHPEESAGMRQAAAAAASAASCAVKGAGDAKEAATNQPSPRSVLAAAASPPISPTTSLPTTFPYQLVLPPPSARERVASAAAPSPAEGRVGVRPTQTRGLRRQRRARPAPRVCARRTVVPKPRCLFDPKSERTSLMIRNIPNDFTRMRLMNILDEHCFIENERNAPGAVRSGYDFLYLPIDFRSLANKGYAFVNMTSPEAARRLWEDLHQHRWAFKSTTKTCAVDYAARQGHDELVQHFSGSRFECHTEEYLPVRFEPPRDGTRLAVSAMHVVGRLARPRAGDGK